MRERNCLEIPLIVNFCYVASFFLHSLGSTYSYYDKRM